MLSNLLLLQLSFEVGCVLACVRSVVLSSQYCQYFNPQCSVYNTDNNQCVADLPIERTAVAGPQE